jgi:hypothetical protein
MCSLLARACITCYSFHALCITADRIGLTAVAVQECAQPYLHSGHAPYYKKYRNIEIDREISILLSIYRKMFGNIVIDIEIPNIAQPYHLVSILQEQYKQKVLITKVC